VLQWWYQTAELEGSIDGDVCTCNWSNLVGHGCRRLRCETSGVVWQQYWKINDNVVVLICDLVAIVMFSVS
jgi:hypothetical protein